MIRILWLHPHTRPLADEDGLAPVLSAIDSFPLARWGRYALNGLPSFRPYTIERLGIDALTQRTLAISLSDREGRWRCLVNLGKHGERPAVLLSGPDAPLDADALEAWLDRLLTTLPDLVRLVAVNTDALEGAAIAPIPQLESTGAWDWVGPSFLSSPAPSLAGAPGEASMRRGGVLHRCPSPRWTPESRAAIEATSLWWASMVC